MGELIQDQISRRDSEMHQLVSIFMECDNDKSGSISREEFVNHCNDRNVRALLRGLGLNTDLASRLFDILDPGEKDDLNIQDLVIACMQLKGTASAVDIASYHHTLMLELKDVRQQLLQAASLQDEIRTAVI